MSCNQVALQANSCVNSLMDFAEIFPEELSIEVFGHLDPQELLEACKVCRNWKRLTEDNSLWRPFCPKEFSPLPKVNIKTALLERYVFIDTKEELVHLFRQLIDEVNIDRKHEFKCFSHNPKQKELIVFKYKPAAQEDETCLKARYFFTKTTSILDGPQSSSRTSPTNSYSLASRFPLDSEDYGTEENNSREQGNLLFNLEADQLQDARTSFFEAMMDICHKFPR